MKLNKRTDGQQLWVKSNIVGDGYDYYMIVFDNLTGKFRLLSLESGNILNDEYEDIAEIKKVNGELNPISHADISVS